jgi:hypothetical protein
MDAEPEVDPDTAVEKSYAGNILVFVLQSGSDNVNQIHDSDPNIENNETRNLQVIIKPNQLALPSTKSSSRFSSLFKTHIPDHASDIYNK